MERADVVVVGAGPAGSAAAITLARAGQDVLVIDKAAFPRDKCCGDGLTTGALRELESLGLRTGAVASWTGVDAAWVRSPSGRTVQFPFPDGHGSYAVVARRADLDSALLQLAREAGARVLDGHGLCSIDVSHPDAVVVGVEGDSSVRASHVIAADGMWSPVRRQLGLAEPGTLGEWHALRQYLSGVTGSAAERLWVWLEPDLLPGYAWSFPLGGGVINAGFGVLRDRSRAAQHLTTRWNELLERPHIVDAIGATARAESAPRSWPIPAHIDRAVLGRGRVLFAGDAAGTTDPLTGEGISQALITGRLAGAALAAGGRPEATVAMYRDAVLRCLVADHRISIALGRLIRYELGARGAVRVAGLSAWTRRNFARWLFEDEPRAALLTPRRWHRRFLQRPGAYV